MFTPPAPTECHECESTELSWSFHVAVSNLTPANGAPLARDAHAQIVLGCDECSATVAVVERDGELNALLGTERSAD